MICARCGKEAKSNTKYCMFCGRDFSKEERQAAKRNGLKRTIPPMQPSAVLDQSPMQQKEYDLRKKCFKRKTIFGVLSIITICVAIVLILNFVDRAKKGNTSESTESTQNDNSPNSPEVNVSGIGDVEAVQGVSDVEITIPASFMTGERNSELTAEDKEDGIKKVVINSDGSMTMTMTKSAHDKLLKDIKTSIDEIFEEYVSGAESSSIKRIERNDDLTKITVFVDGAAYKSMHDSFIEIAVMFQIRYYHVFSGTPENQINPLIEVIDEATGAVIDILDNSDSPS